MGSDARESYAAISAAAASASIAAILSVTHSLQFRVFALSGYRTWECRAVVRGSICSGVVRKGGSTTDVFLGGVLDSKRKIRSRALKGFK